MTLQLRKKKQTNHEKGGKMSNKYIKNLEQWGSDQQVISFSGKNIVDWINECYHDKTKKHSTNFWVTPRGLIWDESEFIEISKHNPLEDWTFTIELVRQVLSKATKKPYLLQNPNWKIGSYGAKHLIENYISHYVPNGVVIAAALSLGRYMVAISPWTVRNQSPNCSFCISQKFWNKLEAEADDKQILSGPSLDVQMQEKSKYDYKINSLGGST